MGEHDWDMLANQWDADELADWGLDVPGDEEAEPPGSPETKTLSPYQMTHVLFSFPPYLLADIQGYIEKIANTPLVQYEQSSN